MSEWQPIRTYPKGTLAEFQNVRDDVVSGYAQPFWCGSDCPCGDPDDEDYGEPLTAPPECWALTSDPNGPKLMRWRPTPPAGE